MFKRTLQQQQWFKDSVCIKYGKKSYFIKDCKNSQQNYIVKSTNMAQNNNYIKVIREYLIKHFAFRYNSACKVHKDAEYGVGWWPQEPELSYIGTGR